MTPRAVDSLDFVQAVMMLEGVLGIKIPTDDAEQFGSANGRWTGWRAIYGASVPQYKVELFHGVLQRARVIPD